MDRWLLIDLLHRVYGKATLSRDFREERDKKIYILKYCGAEGHIKYLQDMHFRREE